MPSVLFVCTGNRYRSLIAAAAFRRMLMNTAMASQWVVGSTGTWTVPGLSPVPSAIHAAAALGLDITNDKSNLINQAELAKYNLVLVMETGHKEAILSEFPQMRDRVYLLSDVAAGMSYDIPDPMESEGEESDEIAAEICDLIQRGFQNIIQLAGQVEANGSGAV